MNKKEKKFFYLKYTCLFVFFMTLILYFYYSIGKATVNNSNDGFKQIYRALLYLSNYYKTILNNIFVNHTFIIPQWDFVLGEGGDIIETFHYYGLGDPINLLSVFFNESNLYIFHDISIFIRMYLAGFVFSKLCFYKKYNNSIVVLAGSLLYAYSSYAIRVLTNYIYFINPLIYFPLIILAIEKLIEENKGTLLTIAVALASITSIYFFYMIVIATVIYVAIRLVTVNYSFKEIINKLIKIFVYSLFGVLISSIIFMPAAYSMLGNSRIGEKLDIALFYSADEYLELFTNMVFNNYSGWYNGGYTVLGYFGIISILINKGNKTLKVLLLASLIVMSFPFFGSLFNGMTYIVNRYEFFLCFLATYCAVACYDNLSCNKKDAIICFVMLIVYTIIAVLNNNGERNTYLLFFGIGILALLGFVFIKNNKIKNYIYLLTALCSIMFVIVYKYLPNYWNYAATHGRDITHLTNIHNEEPSVFKQIDDDTFYRYSGNSLPDNVSINGSKSSTGYYWSVANNSIAEFRTYNGFHDETNFYFNNYDGDYILNTLAGVKYYFAKEEETIPYGYRLYKTYDDNNLYINNKSLPLFYGYDYCISLEDYTNTNVLQRKELITQAVVTDCETSKDYKFNSDVNKIESKVSNSEGILLDNRTIETSIDNSQINLAYNSKIAGEYYFVIEDVYSDKELYISVKNKHDVSKTFIVKIKNSHAYDGRHSFVINLGYYDEIEDVVTLTIPSVSEMTYRNFGIYCLPLNNSIHNLENLNCIEIDNLEINTNNVKAKVKSSQDKYLCISIPNYDGWIAYLDGKKVELHKYNIMYMGLPISKGEHNIELKYSTPLLKEGSIVSLISVISFVIFETINKRKDNLT